MTTSTDLSEIKAKLEAQIEALAPSHKHLYINSLMAVLSGRRPDIDLEELPEPVKNALALYGAMGIAHKVEHFQVEEKQRQDAPLIATATELLKSLIVANPGMDPQHLAAQAMAAAHTLHDPKE